MDTIKIRIPLGILGILCIIYAFYLIFSSKIGLNPVALTSYLPVISMLIFGYFAFKIAREWQNSFFWAAKLSLNVTLLFFALTVLFFSIYFHSQEIVDSVDPSINKLVETLLTQKHAENSSYPDKLPFVMTYDKLMGNMSLTIGNSSPYLAYISTINTKQKLTLVLERNKQKAQNYLAWTIVFTVICLTLVFIHKKFFTDKKLSLLFKTLSFELFIGGLLSTIALVIGIYVLEENILFPVIAQFFTAEAATAFQIIPSLPIFLVFIKILYSNVYPLLILTIFALSSFITCHYLNQKSKTKDLPKNN
jgi:hypothetical protein